MKHMLLRFLLRHMLIGIGIGWSLAGLLLVVDYQGLWGLISRSPDGVVAMVLLLAGFAITFGSVGMGLAIFSLDYDEPENRVGLRRQLVRPLLVLLNQPPPELRPIPVRPERKRR